MTQTCCLDDQNLSHTFNILRITELLENCAPVLNVRQQGEIVLAVIGELDLMARDLKQSIEGLQNLEETPEMKCVRLIEATQRQIIDFICECGRDRASFMKEQYCRISLAGSRPRSCRSLR